MPVRWPASADSGRPGPGPKVQRPRLLDHAPVPPEHRLSLPRKGRETDVNAPSYRAPGTTARPLRIGLLGAGPTDPCLRALYQVAADSLGLGLDCRPVDTTMCVLPDDPGDLFRLLMAEGFDGIDIVPTYTPDILPALDEVSDIARKVGAADMVVFRGGRSVGYSSIHRGIAAGLARGLPGARMGRVLLLGAGKSGRMAGHALLDCGVVQVLVHDSDDDAANTLARWLSDSYGIGRAGVVTDLAAAAAATDGIVSSLPATTATLPLPRESLNATHWVAEIAGSAQDTALIAAARSLVCATLPGVDIALNRVAAAFELFTGLAPDITRMRAARDKATKPGTRPG